MTIRSPKLRAGARIIHRAAVMFLEKRITRSAAALSFFLTMSIFPFLLCLSWLVGILNVDMSSSVSFFGGFVPQDTIAIIDEYLSYIHGYQSIPMLVLGLATMVSTSSSAFRVIRSAMDDIHDRAKPRGLKDWLLGFVPSFIFLLSVYFCIILLLTGGWFLRLLNTHFGIGSFITHWNWIRFLVLFGFVLGMVYGMYRVSAPRQKPRVPVFRGALLTAFSLVVVSVLFSMFIGLSARYSLVYGSLASIIILMIWLYLCCNILFIGGILNVVLFHRRLQFRRKKKAFPAPYTEEPQVGEPANKQ